MLNELLNNPAYAELNKEERMVAEVVINDFYGDVEDALYYAEGQKYTIYDNEFELVDSLNIDETEYDSFEEVMDDVLSENTNLVPLNDGRYLELHRSCLIHFA